MTKPTIAFGPEAPGWGSWDWVGADVMRALSRDRDVRSFAAWELPDCDLVVAVKHAPPPGWIEAAARRAAVVYCPVDAYGDPREIDDDGPRLRRCARIVIHCERLRRYFEPYAPVEYMDHHIKFAATPSETRRVEGNALWVGVRSNLPPLVEWINARPLPVPLDVLTNPEDPDRTPTPTELGFRPGTAATIHRWSPERQRELTATAIGVIDVKGDDFRARHKPPAKALDAIASGVPLAMNPDSAPVEHLARLGFDVCSPLDVSRWFSSEYWEETRRFGAAIRELLSSERIAFRYRRLLDALPLDRPTRAASDRERG